MAESRSDRLRNIVDGAIDHDIRLVAQLKQRIAELEGERLWITDKLGLDPEVVISGIQGRLHQACHSEGLTNDLIKQQNGWTDKLHRMSERLQEARQQLADTKEKRGPIVDAADLKADECGCNVAMRRYSNPFHRAYYKVSRCEFHENAAAEHRDLRQRLTASEERLQIAVEALTICAHEYKEWQLDSPYVTRQAAKSALGQIKVK